MESIEATNNAPATEMSPSRKTQINEAQARHVEELERSAVTAEDNESAAPPANADLQLTTAAASGKNSQISSKKRKLSQITGGVEDELAGSKSSKRSSKRVKLNTGEMVEKKSQKSTVTSQQLTQSEMNAVIQEIDKLSVENYELNKMIDEKVSKTPTVHEVDATPSAAEAVQDAQATNSKSKDENAVAKIYPPATAQVESVTSADIEMPDDQQEEEKKEEVVATEANVDATAEQHAPEQVPEPVVEQAAPVPEAVEQVFDAEALFNQAILLVFQGERSSDFETKTDTLSNPSSEKQDNNVSMETQNDGHQEVVDAPVDVDEVAERVEEEVKQEVSPAAVSSKQSKIAEEVASEPAPQ